MSWYRFKKIDVLPLRAVEAMAVMNLMWPGAALTLARKIGL